MIHYKRAKLIFDGDECYRKELFKVMRVQSSNCNMCSVCTSSSSNHDTEKAKCAIRQRHREKQQVIDLIHSLAEKCMACGNTSCNGVSCMEHYKNRCFKCLAISVGKNYHKSSECYANNIDTQQKSCPFCFLSLSTSLQEWNKSKDHMFAKCVFKERIKRILLFDTQNQNDKGISAKKVLQSCLVNESIWFETMAKNISKMEIK